MILCARVYAVAFIHRLTELLSRMKYGNRAIFYHRSCIVIDRIFKHKKKPDFSEKKLIWVEGLGWGWVSRLGLYRVIVSTVVFG